MSDTKLQWEPTGLERFGHLEDKLFRIVEGYKAVRKENETLRGDNEKLKGELETFRQSEAALNKNIAGLQKEREDLRERVEKALALLATLEIS
jgi:FtsZ-binding cell division protein ZapB